MKLFYVSFMCSESYYSKLFRNAIQKPCQATQKFNRLLSEGIALDSKCEVIAISELPIDRETHKKRFFKQYIEKQNNIEYVYLPIINIHRIKDILSVFSSFFEIMHRCFFLKEKKFIISYALNAPVAFGSMVASKILGCKYFSVITDLPELVYLNSDRVYKCFTDISIKYSDGFIILTEAMKDRLPIGNKPYVVIEGLVDSKIKMDNKDDNQSDVIDNEKLICLYAGSIQSRYGISYMVDGFILANIPNAELHIYGSGDYEEKLEEICKKNKNVVFHGSVLVDEVINAQKKATLLINPRPTGEEYTKYSFPSKNIEYMSSGTPVLTTNLPGIPLEYMEHVYLLHDESVEGFADRLNEIISKPLAELKNKGTNAKRFVLENKNNYIQGQKVLNMITKYTE